MSELVSINDLHKNYGRKKPIFTGLNLSLESGKIIGLLGPNGSGKTTLIKLLAGLLKEDSGHITIGGKTIGHESKAIVSYLPERTYFNENLRVREVINLFKDFYADFDEDRYQYGN